MATDPARPSRELTVDSGGVRLRAVELGDRANPTIVCVHGYPDTHGCWDELAARLAERYHVVAYDTRGMGRSTAPSGAGGFALPALAEDLIAVIDAVAPGRRVHLVGHDWGAFQCWETICTPRLDERIASFTAVAGPRLDATAGWALKRLRPAPAAIGQLLGQARRSWYIGAMMIPRLPERALRQGMARGWPEAMRRLERIEPRAGHPADTIASDAVTGIALYRTNIGGRRPTTTVVPSKVPVQLIVPTRDRYISRGLYDDAAGWAERVWRREIRTGHWAQRTHPDTVAAYVTELVDHVEGAPESPALARARFSAPGDRFTGALAVVTGAGSGIGRATAQALAAAGAEVIAADIDHEAAVRTSGAAPGRIHPYRVDVADGAAMEAFAEQVRAHHGVPRIVINNAGIGVGGPFLDTTVADWQRILDINLWGVIHGSRLFARQMLDAGVEGQIVNTASAAAYTPSRILSAYSTTKAAVLMLSQCLRAELAGQGIGVTAICPGIVNTNITRTTHMVGVSAEREAAMQSRTAGAYERRGYGPERVASAILAAIRRDTALAPVTPEAHAMLAMSRLTPGLLRLIARTDPSRLTG